MLNILLRISDEDQLQYFIIGIGSLIAWLFLLRWAFKVNSLVKNQEIIIQIMMLQLQKNGATEEEIKQLREQIVTK